MQCGFFFFFHLLVFDFQLPKGLSRARSEARGSDLRFILVRGTRRSVRGFTPKWFGKVQRPSGYSRDRTLDPRCAKHERLNVREPLGHSIASLENVELFHFVVPKGIPPMGNSGCFPQGKPAASESRYPTLTI